MPFTQRPIPCTYIDVTGVTDPEHERLKVTFENGMVVMLRINPDTCNWHNLSIDKARSDAAVIEKWYKYCYDLQLERKSRRKHLFGGHVVVRWNVKRVAKYSLEQLEEIVTFAAGDDMKWLVRLDDYWLIMPGRPMNAVVIITGTKMNAPIALAEGSRVKTIESVTITD